MDEKTIQIAVMGRIYYSAWATIVALSSLDS
jgi:hypothetical protein